MARSRLLIVDDSPFIRQVIADTFEPSGYIVSTAGDGAEALRRIRRDPPDLIIADIIMPVMDGWALCEEVRREPTLAGIPFIFLTTETDVPKRIKGLEMGADDYVCKPFSKEELLARANSVLRRARPAAEPAPRPPGGGRERLRGHTDHMAMADLLQILGQSGHSGTLHLSGQSVGRIYFRDGVIINAETQALKGEKALFRIIAWPSTRFEFEPGDPERSVEEELTSAMSTVLMEGFAHLDELRSLIESLPPASQKLRVPEAAEEGIDERELKTSERLILYKAGRRGAALGDLVDMVPERDLNVYRDISDLLQRGLLEPVEH